MLNYKIFTFIVLCFFSVDLAGAGESNSLEIKSVEKSPELDGVLKDNCWTQNNILLQFFLGKTDNKIKMNTEVFLVHDQKWLYVAINSKHPDPENMPAEIRISDGAIHLDESVEIFIDPGTKGKTYFHFQCNTNGIRSEKMFKDKVPVTEWNGPWLSAVRRNSGGWTGEFAFPIQFLQKYGNLSGLRINIARNQVVVKVDPYDVVTGYERRIVSLSKVKKSLHEPERFSSVILSGLKVPKSAFLPCLEKIIVSDLESDGQHIFRSTKIIVRNYGKLSGRTTLSVRTPASAETSELITLDSLGRFEHKLNIPFKIDDDPEVQVRIINSDSAKVLSRRDIVGDITEKIATVFFDRSYYTTENTAALVCEFNLPSNILKDCRTVVSDNNRKVLLKKPASGRLELEVPLNNVSIGIQNFILQLQTQNTGDVIYEKHIKLIKRRPRPGFEFKIDHRRRVVLNNGKPFVTTGMVMYGIKADDKECFQEIAEAGFSSVVHWGNNHRVCEVESFAKIAAENGLLVVAKPDAVSSDVSTKGLDNILNEPLLSIAKKRLESPGNRWVGMKQMLKTDSRFKKLPSAVRQRVFDIWYEGSISRFEGMISTARKCQPVMAYMPFEESKNSLMFEIYKQGRKIYALIDRLDGYRPVFALKSGLDPRMTGWSDILGDDPYWVPPKGIRSVFKTTVKYDKVAMEQRKPVWKMPMAEIYSGSTKRSLTPQEQRCQTYLALMGGATGLLWFKYPVLHEDMWQTFKTLNEEISKLTNILIRPALSAVIELDCSRKNPKKERTPPVVARFRQNPKREPVLLLANTLCIPVKASLRITGVSDTKAVERMFSPTKYVLKDDSFTDDLEPFATRAYLLKGGKFVSGNETLLTISLQKTSEDEGKENVIPRSGRVDHKNLVPNPSFEKATIRDWPNYFRPVYGLLKPRIGEQNAAWGLDYTQAWEGRASLKMRKTPELKKTGFELYLAPQTNKKAEYTISIYLKANRNGLEAQLKPGFLPAKSIKLSTQWQRYTITGSLKPGTGNYNIVRLIFTEKGTVWADALQVEKGLQATNFEP